MGPAWPTCHTHRRLRLELADVKRAKADLERELRAANAKRVAAETAIAEARGEVAKGESARADLQVRLDAANNELRSRGEAADALSRRGRELLAAVEHAHAERRRTEERCAQLHAALCHAEGDVAASTAAVEALRHQLSEEHRVREATVQAVRDEARRKQKSERERLVRAALHSLHSLRTHLVAAACSERSGDGDGAASAILNAKLSWRPEVSRWVLLSENHPSKLPSKHPANNPISHPTSHPSNRARATSTAQGRGTGAAGHATAVTKPDRRALSPTAHNCGTTDRTLSPHGRADSSPPLSLRRHPQQPRSPPPQPRPAATSPSVSPIAHGGSSGHALVRPSTAPSLTSLAHGGSGGRPDTAPTNLRRVDSAHASPVPRVPEEARSVASRAEGVPIHLVPSVSSPALPVVVVSSPSDAQLRSPAHATAGWHVPGDVAARAEAVRERRPAELQRLLDEQAKLKRLEEEGGTREAEREGCE